MFLCISYEREQEKSSVQKRLAVSLDTVSRRTRLGASLIEGSVALFLREFAIR